MKTLLTILMIISCTLCNAQTDTNKINLNLDKFHKQYRTGTVFMAIGSVVALAGIASVMNDNEQEPVPVYFGTLLVSIGAVIHIDAHKFFHPKRRK